MFEGAARGIVKRCLTWTVPVSVVAISFFGAPSAIAAKAHPYIGSFGAFSHPSGIAVDEADGNVFVADGGVSNSVDIYGPEGEAPVGVANPQIAGFSFGGEPSGLAIDNSTSTSKGDLYVADVGNRAVKKYGLNPASGEYELVEELAATPAFGETLGVAVGGTGEVFVADYGSSSVVEFGPTGTELGRIDVSGSVGHPSSVALDSKGDLFVQSYDNGSVYKYEANGSGEVEPGTTPTEIVEAGARGLTVDSSTDTLYVALGEEVAQFDALTGAPEPQFGFGSGRLGATERLAVDSSTGRIYVADNGEGKKDVAIFGPLAVQPKATTGEATNVGATSATLNGSVTPGGAELEECAFEYGLDESYGRTLPCAESPAEIGAGESPVPVHAELAGLETGVTYHYRLLARNAEASGRGADRSLRTTAPYPPAPAPGSCPNEALRYGFGRQLPDCRAYEQASPVDKNAGGVAYEVNRSQAAEGGGAVTLFSDAGIPGGVGAQDYGLYLALRDGGQWQTQGLYPPPAYGQEAAILGWSPDLSLTIDQARRLGGGFGLFARDNTTGSLTPITGYIDLADQHGSFYLAGISSGDDLVLFESRNALPSTPDAIAGKSNLYLWDRATGTVTLTGVGNDGLPPEEGAFAGPYAWFESIFPEVGGAAQGYYTMSTNVISGDGSRVFFTSSVADQLYMRSNPTAPQSAMAGGRCTQAGRACTVEVSASQRTAGADPNGPQPAAFMSATPDGGYVFFTSPGALTDDATTGPADEGNDLYRYEAASGRLMDLVPDHEVGDPNGADVLGVLGASDDGSYVYFVANGVLAAGARRGDCANQRGGGGLQPGGECSLYLWHGTPTSGSISLVARLDNEGGQEVADANDWRGISENSGIDRGKTARVSPDGRTVLFRSRARLTHYDSEGVPEYYRFRVGSGLVCVSCDPTGAAPTGAPALQGNPALASPPGATPILTRNLSASGDRVFFETPDPLVASDTNGVADVYEWEADGTGSCRSEAQDGGCLFLLSSGRAATASHFVDASASGDDAFLLTEQPLVGQDRDQLADVYDVRVEGGLPAQDPIGSPPCGGEACRGPSAPAPEAAPPGTSSFVGPPNPAPARHSHRRHRKKHGRHHHGKGSKVKQAHRKKSTDAKQKQKRPQHGKNAEQGRRHR